MPFPGGVLALQQSLSFYGSRRSLPPLPDDVIAYNEAQRFFADNVKCTIGLFQGVIPSCRGKLTGVLVVEAKQEVSHDGIFILLKGQALEKRKKDVFRLDGAKKPVKAVKFNVLGYGKTSPGQEDGVYKIETGTESYPLDVTLPKAVEDLPPPQINYEGRLMYRVQAYMFSGEKCILVGETWVQFQGYYNLLDEPQDTSAPIKIEQQLQYKKNYLSKKKVVDIYCSVGTSGYLPGESIDFLLVAKNPDKIPIECKVELVQKAWYQARQPRITGSLAGSSLSRRLSVKMLANTVESALKVEQKSDGISKELVWKGQLQVPGNQPPTYKFDFFNSISYIIKMTVKVQGDRDAKVVGEAPIYIGTTREKRDEDSDEEEDDVDGTVDSEVDSHSGAETPLVPMMNLSRSMIALNRRDSFPNRISRARAGSIASVSSFHSYASSTPSVFRLPPSYSQLSSRRPTLETLPPTYGEAALREQPSQEETETCPLQEETAPP